MIFGSTRTIRETIDRSIVSAFTTPITTSSVAVNFANQAITMNNTFVEELSRLTKIRTDLQTDVDSNPGVNQSYRNRGVNLAWEYEKLDVSMGGTGTREYTSEQIEELLETGKVRGMEGQHINSAATHPELQGNPDNIKMLTHDEHFAEHNYNWRNQAEGDLIDKDKMVSDTNRRRIIKNDLTGLGISAAIGFGMGFAISTIMELAKTGVYNIEISKMIKNSLASGVESASISSVTYVGGRFAAGLLQQAGLDMTTNLGQAFGVSTIGILSIALISTYQYVKMTCNGKEKEEAFDLIGKQMLMSLISFAATALATGIWGGTVGLIVSIGTTLVYVGTNVGSAIHERKFNERLREYTVEQYKPIYIE